MLATSVSILECEEKSAVWQWLTRTLASPGTPGQTLLNQRAKFLNLVNISSTPAGQNKCIFQDEYITPKIVQCAQNYVYLTEMKFYLSSSTKFYPVLNNAYDSQLTGSGSSLS